MFWSREYTTIIIIVVIVICVIWLVIGCGQRCGDSW
jgi:hypothetical protein